MRDFIVNCGKLFKHLRSKWKVILCAAIIGAATGLYYASTKETTYKAVLTFALEEDSGSSFGGALGIASQLGFDFGGSSGIFTGDNLIELMRSRSMIERALLTPVIIGGKENTLAEHYIDMMEYRADWGENPKLKDLDFGMSQKRESFTRVQDSVLGRFYNEVIRDNLTVEQPEKGVSIISVTTTSPSEYFSKYFTEVLVEEVSEFYVKTRTQKSATNLAILQHQVDSVRNALTSAISGVAAYREEFPNQNSALQRLNVPSQKRQFDVRSNESILTELVKNLEVLKISLRKETPLIQIIDKPILPLEKERLGKGKAMVLGALIVSMIVVFGLVCKLLYGYIMNNG